MHDRIRTSKIATDALGQEAPDEGRTASVTMKLSKREERAAGVIAEIRGVGVSTLLHGTPVADVVREYDRFIEMAKQAS